MKDIWAAVPIKDTRRSKQRLSPALDAAERQALMLVMAEDVLSALAACRALAGILVVTIDPAAQALAARYGARVLSDGADGGHTEAVASAAYLLEREGRAAMLTLPADVPGVTEAGIAALIAAAPPAPSVTFVPAHDRKGTNAALCATPTIIPLRFGGESFQPHLRVAAEAGITPVIRELPGAALDIDEPSDLAAFLRLPSETRTRRWLHESGVAARLG